ncbi:endonuclease/exonuclease/phosphatase family protein [Natronomonas marina]|uniref:endonuclease/exonuclease/phosphatase family protein n=1 Tax=Natronomonas marina TaxID=2961939 RepID=UPI0020C9D694|nr:endonuclease/exonuclease/phosphatase family protein [Natronomonas marina]
MVPHDAARVSRRRLLSGAAALAASGGVLSAPAAAEAPTLSVMTRNLYVGVDLFRLFEAGDFEQLRAVAGELLADVEAHPYAARAGAVAGEIASTEPDVVCVQEAALVRTRAPSRFDGDHDPGASEVVVDLLGLLSERLAARGLDYGVETELVTNDVEVPADTGDGTVDLRLTNRIAVLTREDVTVTGTRGDRFAAAVPVPLEGIDLAIERGFAGVDVAVEGRPATVATTHLAALSAGIRNAQAGALVDRLPGDRPVVLAGDFNSGPGSGPGAYELLRESFEDAHATLRPDAAGPTCCHGADLRTESSTLSRRVDAVLYRGGARPTGIDRVGETPADRVAAETDGETVRVWPSDHAGVVGSLSVPPTATATPTATSGTSPTATPTGGTDTPAAPTNDGPEPQPGMGVVTAVLAGVAATLAALRRRTDEVED